jgi:hypothetical protein
MHLTVNLKLFLAVWPNSLLLKIACVPSSTLQLLKDKYVNDQQSDTATSFNLKLVESYSRGGREGFGGIGVTTQPKNPGLETSSSQVLCQPQASCPHSNIKVAVVVCCCSNGWSWWIFLRQGGPSWLLQSTDFPSYSQAKSAFSQRVGQWLQFQGSSTFLPVTHHHCTPSCQVGGSRQYVTWNCCK